MTLGKMIEIISLFQDSKIGEMSRDGSDLNVKLECDFLASLISKEYRCFYTIFKSCTNVYFKPWDDDQNIITNLKQISNLGLQIINTERQDDGFAKIYVNCENTFPGGNLIIKCNDLIVFDEDFQEMNLISLTEISEKYWFSSDKAEG